ncbi:hypothetical protein SKAU_G00159840 [Synaphobranchus kaupii]|uniref:Ubiquitin-like domain-containing protein n=1 Tax=Synaphobranchus kaupii TaxID=118154 RepID=A0A9Q1IXJ2_SYNKA|nr:hypothetical protein SKAU_G00159840 [Synaphobranchus kaupii]
MIVFVRFNSSRGFPLELEDGASVGELKEEVGRQQGVRPEQLRVIFAGRELRSDCTLQGCDLPEQSTVHVVLPPPAPAHGLDVVLQNRLGQGVDSLTRVDLSASRLPTSSDGLAAILETDAKTESRSHSSFYVFCKTVCRAIQPGKLRVRCRTCKQGTLTLSRYHASIPPHSATAAARGLDSVPERVAAYAPSCALAHHLPAATQPISFAAYATTAGIPRKPGARLRAGIRSCPPVYPAPEASSYTSPWKRGGIAALKPHGRQKGQEPVIAPRLFEVFMILWELLWRLPHSPYQRWLWLPVACAEWQSASTSRFLNWGCLCGEGERFRSLSSLRAHLDYSHTYHTLHDLSPHTRWRPADALLPDHRKAKDGGCTERLGEMLRAADGTAEGRLQRVSTELARADSELLRHRARSEHLAQEKRELRERERALSRQVDTAVMVIAALRQQLSVSEQELERKEQEVITIHHFLEAAVQHEMCGKVRLQNFIENLLQRISLAERLLKYYQSTSGWPNCTTHSLSHTIENGPLRITKSRSAGGLLATEDPTERRETSDRKGRSFSKSPRESQGHFLDYKGEVKSQCRQLAHYEV